jgi:ribonuclease VapC
MVIDTSAVVAIIEDEPDAESLTRRLSDATSRRMSAASVVEAAIVLEGHFGDVGGDRLDLFLARSKIEIVPLTEEQTRIARKAWRRYGKGRGQAAGLNFGDCFSYALAKSLGEELLFKGKDFAHTDVARTLD